MSLQILTELVGRPGVFQFLDGLLGAAARIQSHDVPAVSHKVGMTTDTFSDLTQVGILGTSTDGFYLSQLGQKTALLLRAVNDTEALAEVLGKLSDLYPGLRPYELITHDVTNFFIDNLFSRTDFIRIYICSPWIRLDDEHLEKVRAALARSPYAEVEINVITLPMHRYNDARALRTVRHLKNLGAEVFTNERLHAKLYISEPGPRGGSQYAIFGSENLTGRKNIELGLKIENDNELLGKLANFFRSIQFDSLTKVLDEEEL